MYVRVHFSCADLARTAIGHEADPLREAVLGMRVLQTDELPAVYGLWRRRTKPRLTTTERELLTLTPPVGRIPDFLTPWESIDGLEAGLFAIAATPSQRLRSELSRLSDDVRLPRWTRQLAAGDSAILTKVCYGLRHFHRTKIAPLTPAISVAIAADVKRHRDAVTSGGFEKLANTLHPAIHWQAPVLSCQVDQIDRDLYLRGSGLRLVPSFFCATTPTMPQDPDLPPELVYPVTHASVWPEPTGGRMDPEHALADLIGRTRAVVLREISRGACSTSQLAEQAGISLASASEHAGVLHRTGLVTTYRFGNAVRHAIRPIGEELLNGGIQHHDVD
ncbi:ArsR/SmtB family transcription factor [Kribbella sp. GL6]|uniref:ArsR/SmtB family transcription factor n=1 Tax=Kribbella sp. GL6 TaxID=3419765 RepID=UPI003D022657